MTKPHNLGGLCKLTSLPRPSRTTAAPLSPTCWLQQHQQPPPSTQNPQSFHPEGNGSRGSSSHHVILKSTHVTSTSSPWPGQSHGPSPMARGVRDTDLLRAGTASVQILQTGALCPPCIESTGLVPSSRPPAQGRGLRGWKVAMSGGSSQSRASWTKTVGYPPSPHTRDAHVRQQGQGSVRSSLATLCTPISRVRRLSLWVVSLGPSLCLLRVSLHLSCLIFLAASGVTVRAWPTPCLSPRRVKATKPSHPLSNSDRQRSGYTHQVCVTVMGQCVKGLQKACTS